MIRTGLLIWMTEYYTGTKYRPVKTVAQSSTTGHGTNVIQGLAISMEATAVPALIIVAGILFTLLALLEGSNLIIAYCVGIFTFLAGLICNLMVGATNKARDEGDDKLFATLHRISVVLTISVLLTNLLWIFIV